ncbi:gliding motility-associated C-terminal domain-containing protein [Flavobacterium kingsejongi]|uniref:Ig-like domain-containing protein n=1 Tax=Flavobacterium kingsejongi TaxID=1678728 RepID=A0A2S1LNA9_9FLAO|nr:gliding motility-associated C-terminal domain-containing protein [Flavobacterium kingsejongi]AWG25235.1 hypothetical protein FK004_08305 [Flavobacterium kingsejongi]
MIKNYPKIIIIVLFFFYTISGLAQLPNFTLNVTVTPETCAGNGTLSFTTSGTQPGATIVYSVYKLPNTTVPIATLSAALLSGQTSGNYRIVATQTLGSQSSSQQKDVTITSQISTLNFTVTGSDAICGNNGSISTVPVSGNPVSYEIFSGPVIRPLQPTGVFNNLVAGNYLVRVFDACGDALVRSFSIMAPNLSPDGFAILEPQFSMQFLPQCDRIIADFRIDVEPGYYMVYPLTCTFTAFPPGGGAPVITTSVINGTSGYHLSGGITPPYGQGPYSSTIPYFEGTYTYNMVITDACGTAYVRNNNIVNQPFRANAAVMVGLCGGKMITINATNLMMPVQVEFLTAPAGFIPTDFNPLHPNFSVPGATGIVKYGTPEHTVPEGLYNIKVTDACGRVATSQIVVENGSEVRMGASYPDCTGTLFTASVDGTPIASIVFNSGPSGMPYPYPFDASAYISNGTVAMEGILVSGSYNVTLVDICGNSYVRTLNVGNYAPQTPGIKYLGGCDGTFGSVQIGSGTVFLTSAILLSGPQSYAHSYPHDVTYNIANGTFSMNSLPAGIYQLQTIDRCNTQLVLTLFIGSYSGYTETTVTDHCSSFDLFLEHTNNNSLENYGFWLQKKNELTNEWTDPSTGMPYPENTIPTAINSTVLINTMTNFNVGGEGLYRIITVSKLYDNGITTSLLPCYHILKEFRVGGKPIINDALNFACTSGASDVLLDATGNGTLIFRITTKDGEPFPMDNGDNPLFSNLATGVYNFQIEDSCGNITNLLHDVSVPYVLSIIPTLCEGQNSTLSVTDFPYLEYQWYRDTAPNTILSTTATLQFTPLNTVTAAGIYHVAIRYPANLNSCLNQVLTYEISADALPNAGADNETQICGTLSTVNLISSLSGNYTAGGSWEQLTPGGTLSGNVWNPETTPFGSYDFKYHVDGFCGSSDEAIIRITLSPPTPTPVIIAPDSVCSGGSLPLTIQDMTAIGMGFSWTGPNGFTSTLPNPVLQPVTPEMSGTYNLVVTTGNCPSEMVSVTIVVQPNPAFHFESETVSFCNGQSGIITIVAENFDPALAHFSWYYEGVLTDGLDSAIIEVFETGTYEVIVSYNGCSSRQTITASPNTAVFEIGMQAKCNNDYYSLSVFPINNSYDPNTASYLWSGPNNFYSTAASIDITGMEAGMYTVEVTMENGCTVTQQLYVKKSLCKIPKGLSPNDDNQNDNFDLSGMDILKLKIFNRYGREVFEQDNYEDQWHGQSFNGKLLPSATYYYYIRFKNGEARTGWVYLNRPN